MGSTYGKGLYHSAVFNASADVLGENTKYLLDFYPFEKFEHIARTDEQMNVLRQIGNAKTDDVLFSWVVRYNPTTKQKTPVYGFCLLNTAINKLGLLIGSNEDDVVQWDLPVRPCRMSTGKNSPTMLATNADLDSW